MAHEKASALSPHTSKNQRVEEIIFVWIVNDLLFPLHTYPFGRLEEQDIKAKRSDDDSNGKTKEAVVTSTIVVVVGAFILRLGGRAALMSIMVSLSALPVVHLLICLMRGPRCSFG